MLLSILANTPVWVWGLLAGLVYLGWQQTKDRNVRRIRAYIVPCVMMLWSLQSTLESFGVNGEDMLFWCVGCVTMALVVAQLFPLKSAIYYPNTQQFHINGSWVPFFLILGIFLTKYTVGVMTAMQANVLTLPEVPNVLSMIYGGFSGIFASRALGIWRIERAKVAI